MGTEVAYVGDMGVLIETKVTVTSVRGYNDRARRWHGATIHVHLHEKQGTMANHYRTEPKDHKVVTAKLAAMGVKALVLKWSRELGCNCGCTPGFALRVSEADRMQLAKMVTGKVDITKPMTVEFTIARAFIRPRADAKYQPRAAPPVRQRIGVMPPR